MLKPPFVTVWTIAAWFGAVLSRLGPAVPFEPAAASVWQVPQPADVKTVAPAFGSPIRDSVAGGFAFGAPGVVVGVVVVVGFDLIAPAPSVKTVSLSVRAD